jgi:predicted RNA-binding protein with PIN domain
MTLIIDGHNLIGVMPGIDLADPDDEWQLVQRLRAYCAGRRQLTVVFDSGPGPAPSWRLSGGCVTPRFAPPGVEADAVILQLLRNSKQPRQVTVVTNDQHLAGLVRAEGGLVRSASQFARRLSGAGRPAVASDKDQPKGSRDLRDPAYADIYQGFLDAQRDREIFGAQIDLDARPWIGRLYDDDVDAAALAARWLGRYGGTVAREPLLDALTHRSAKVRAAALLALANSGDRSIVDVVVERLHLDSSSMVREAAAQCLARLGGLEAELALDGAQADPKSKVRKAARQGLAQLRARRMNAGMGG